MQSPICLHRQYKYFKHCVCNVHRWAKCGSPLQLLPDFHFQCDLAGMVFMVVTCVHVCMTSLWRLVGRAFFLSPFSLLKCQALPLGSYFDFTGTVSLTLEVRKALCLYRPYSIKLFWITFTFYVFLTSHLLVFVQF